MDKVVRSWWSERTTTFFICPAASQMSAASINSSMFSSK